MKNTSTTNTATNRDSSETIRLAFELLSALLALVKVIIKIAK